MDYPKSVPSVGLVNGKFVDENPVTGTPGSLVPASWGNGVTQEILNVLAAAGITPEDQKTDQLALALSVLNDWVKLKNKPTTLAGYGITDALQVGRTSRQRPSLSAMDLTDAGTGLGGALEIREAQEVGATQTRYEYAPKILFHWQGLVAKSLAMNSDGELAWAGQKLWNAANFNPDGKANKATTLAGYGITDGLSLGSGGLLATPAPVQGKISDLSSSQFVTATDGTSDKPAALSYGSGLHVKYPGGKYGFDLLSGITNEWFGVRKVAEDGSGVWRALWHDGNFNPAVKADKATTLAGYGITDGVSALSFLKPVAGQWVLLGGSGVLPAGGTWAFYCTNYNGNGAALGGNAGVAAGGTATGNGNCVGFAWRIQ